MSAAATFPGVPAAFVPHADAATRSVPRALGRVAGLAYLALAIGTGFAHAAATSLYVPGEATATATRLATDPAFVRIAVVAALVGSTAWVIFALVLARLLRDAGDDAARALIVFSSLGAGILMLSAALQVVAMRVATGAVDLTVLGADGSAGVALLLLDLHHWGGLAATVFMGMWLFPFGLLVWRSDGMLPRWIGPLLVAGGVCYLSLVLTALLAPEAYEATRGVLPLVPTAPEVAVIAFLLVVGVRAPRRARA